MVYNKFMEDQVTSLIDAHVHISGQAGLETLAAAGIAACRNAGRIARDGNPEAVCEKQGPGRPIVISSCRALYKRGGYGARFGLPVETRSQITEEIRQLKKAGADVVKIVASGMVSIKKPGTITPGGFSADEIRFIVEEAAAVGLEVMAHANGEAAIMAAVEAGVRSIEHGFYMPYRAVEIMAEKDIFWTPTTGALRRAADAGGITQASSAFLMTIIAAHLDMVRQAHASGVPLAVGTDCVLPDPHYRAAYETELACFKQAGIPSTEVARIAGEGGARLLGLTPAVLRTSP
jgi:hypothetical protein